jgi:hypothetical protein
MFGESLCQQEYHGQVYLFNIIFLTKYIIALHLMVIGIWGIFVMSFEWNSYLVKLGQHLVNTLQNITLCFTVFTCGYF